MSAAASSGDPWLLGFMVGLFTLVAVLIYRAPKLRHDQRRGLALTAIVVGVVAAIFVGAYAASELLVGRANPTLIIKK